MIEPSSAMTALVFAVILGFWVVSAIDPATMKRARRFATSRSAPSVGPSIVSAEASRPSSGPM